MSLLFILLEMTIYSGISSLYLKVKRIKCLECRFPTTVTKAIKQGQGKKAQKDPFKLVDEEEEEVQQEPEPQGEGEDLHFELAKKMSLDSLQGEGEVEGKGKAIVIEEQAAHSLLDLHKSKKKNTTDQFIIQRCDPATHDATTESSSQPQDDTSEKEIQEKSAPSDSTSDASKDTDSERTHSGKGIEAPKDDKEKGEESSTKVMSEEKTADLNEYQAGSDPGKSFKSQPPPEHEKKDEDQAGPDPGKGNVTLARPNPEYMDEDFYATAYPSIYDNLKLQTDEHVTLETPPIIDISFPQPSLPHVHAPLIIATTGTTSTILALPPHPPTQSLSDPELAARVFALEMRNAKLECVFMIQNKTTNNLASGIFTLEHRDLEYKINNYVRESVKESMQTAL
ncbi:hypothetical protein Tco_0232768 [Tanacetum coccineum]